MKTRLITLLIGLIALAAFLTPIASARIQPTRPNPRLFGPLLNPTALSPRTDAAVDPRLFGPLNKADFRLFRPGNIETHAISRRG